MCDVSFTPTLFPSFLKHLPKGFSPVVGLRLGLCRCVGASLAHSSNMSVEVDKTPVMPAWASDADRVLIYGGESATLGAGGTVSLPGSDGGGDGGSGRRGSRGSAGDGSSSGGSGCCVGYLRVHSPCLLDDDGEVYPVPFEHGASLFDPSTQRTLAVTVELVAEPIFAAEVVRRVSDFKWLADTLGNEHCGACIPPLPLACLAGLQGLQAGSGGSGSSGNGAARSSALASLVLAECSDREGGRGPAAAYGVLLAHSQRSLHRFLGRVLRHRVLGRSPHLWLFLEEQAYSGLGSWTEYVQGVEGRARGGLGAATAAAVGAALAPFGAGLASVGRDVSDAINEQRLAIGSFLKGLGVEAGAPTDAAAAAAAAAAASVAAVAATAAADKAEAREVASPGSGKAAGARDGADSGGARASVSDMQSAIARAASGPESAKVVQEWWGPVVPPHCADADDALAERLGGRLHELCGALEALQQAVARLGGGAAVCGGRAVAATWREVAEVAGLLVAPEVVASAQVEADACGAAERSLLSGPAGVWRQEPAATAVGGVSHVSRALPSLLAPLEPVQGSTVADSAADASLAPPSRGAPAAAAAPAALHLDCSVGEVLAPLAARLGEQHQGRFDELAEQLDDEMGVVLAMRRALAGRQLRRVEVYRALRVLQREMDCKEGHAEAGTAVDSAAAGFGASTALVGSTATSATVKVPAGGAVAAGAPGVPAAQRVLAAAEAALSAVQRVAFRDALDHQASAAPRLKAIFTSFIARERSALAERRASLAHAAAALDMADADTARVGVRAATAARAKLLRAAAAATGGGVARPGSILVAKRGSNLKDNEPGSPNSPSWLQGAQSGVNSSAGAIAKAKANSNAASESVAVATATNSPFGGDFLYGSGSTTSRIEATHKKPSVSTSASHAASFGVHQERNVLVAKFGEGAIGLSFRSIGEWLLPNAPGSVPPNCICPNPPIISLRRQYSVAPGGEFIVRESSGAAAAEGVKPGDRIVALNDISTTEMLSRANAQVGVHCFALRSTMAIRSPL
jgi:hypothetical protein